MESESEVLGTPSISVDYDLFSGHKLDKALVEMNNDTAAEKLKKSDTESSAEKLNEKVLKSTDNAENEKIKLKTEDEKESNEREDEGNQIYVLKYPIGSVIATVEMLFTADEEYLTADPCKS